MTPEERAENILSGLGKLDRYRDVNADFIAAEIRAALKEGVQEASQECGKCSRAHAVYCAECFEGEKRAAVEEAEYKAKASYEHEIHLAQRIVEGVKNVNDHVLAVAREAYEDAAKIADDHNGCVDVKCLSESNCGATIAKQISARKNELCR